MKTWNRLARGVVRSIWRCGFLFVASSIVVHAQTGPGSPMTPPFNGWIEWSKAANAMNTGIIHHWTGADPRWTALFAATDLRWEGAARGDFICADSTRVARITVDPATKRATLFFCLRSIDLYRELHRTFAAHQLATSPEYGHPRLAAIYDRYSDYLGRIVEEDIAAVDAKSSYKAFCTSEFFIFVSLLGHSDPRDCARPDVLEANRSMFQSALATAFFLPPKIVEAATKSRGLTTAELVKEYFSDQSNDEWHSLWLYPVLHEIGHVASCHHGPVLGTDCRETSQAMGATRSIHDRGSAMEIQADAWAFALLVKGRAKAGPMELIGDLSRFTSYQLLSMIKGNREALVGARLSALREVGVTALRLALKQGDVDASTRRQIEKLLE